MTVADDLANRIRPLLAPRDGITEQKMFGGYGFMLHGNMLVGAMKSGELLVRVSPENTAAALARPGAGPMRMGTREMRGFLGVAPDAIDSEAAIAGWIDFAETFVRTLPPK
jgi:TfoX/Sxy family transcriptional regulator of competence genes